MNKSLPKRPLSMIVCTLALGLALGGCSQPDMSGPPGQPGPRTTPIATGQAADHNAHDVMFAQMMIPHHQQAVEMSDVLLVKYGVREDVRKLAMQIKTAQQPEIDTMKGWLTQWNQPLESNHSGHEMGGMLSKQQLDQLANADGPLGQKLYLEGMIGHHEGAIRMAEGAKRMGNSPAVKKMCDDIVRTQNEEITTMKDMLTTM